ncbi:hypothetical protein EDM22_12190 [Agromyces tardus]|jgi:Na+/melibiose symporter-like transporter|uniref:DUF4190 domain-containing protein n=1 Tax=Agromyces tardus TaxID=2583849 RepID=A0A3M8AA66_9MICO|nr:hypothetical protein [Agromyces tardus]RNB47385.1 hypothetical protein EDM22_12190 [Agromyces tardus]
MSANRTGDGDAQPRRLSLAAIAGVLLAIASVLLPATWALPVALIAIVLGVIGYRQARRDPRTGPQWVSVVAMVVGAFVAISQGIILVLVATG